MKYKEVLKKSMEMLAEDPRTVFIGYNITYGSRAYGTLANIPTDRCIETPVAENLMTGLAIGMALGGYRPVLFFERHDFMLNATDALINHLSKVEAASKGEFNIPVIVRATVGSSKPINPGVQHIGDYSNFFKSALSFPVYEFSTAGDIINGYREALQSPHPTMFIERRNLFDEEV